MENKETIFENIKISYIEKTTDNSSVVFFLHGWGASYKTFFYLYKDLNNYLTFDFPGFGSSEKLKKTWSLNDFANFTTKFLEEKTKGKKIIIVAHSFGGRVILKMLENKKYQNIEKIILTGVPFVRNLKFSHKIILFLTKFFKSIFSFLPEKVNTKLKDLWYKKIESSDYKVLKNREERETFKNIIEENIEEKTKNLKNYKTYFIWGKNDKEAFLKDAEKISKKVGAEFFQIKANHFPFLPPTEKEFLEIFNKILEK